MKPVPYGTHYVTRRPRRIDLISAFAAGVVCGAALFTLVFL